MKPTKYSHSPLDQGSYQIKNRRTTLNQSCNYRKKIQPSVSQPSSTQTRSWQLKTHGLDPACHIESFSLNGAWCASTQSASRQTGNGSHLPWLMESLCCAQAQRLCMPGQVALPFPVKCTANWTAGVLPS